MKSLIFCFVFMHSITSVFGQNIQEAKKLLEQVSKKYNGYKTIQSDFEVTVYSSSNESYSDSGTMYFNKPNKQFAILLRDQDILSNGKSIWNIAKDIKEVQVTETQKDDSTIGPYNLFTFYRSGYSYKMLENEKYSKNGSLETLKVIELTPINSKTNYQKIIIRINKNNHIHDVSVFDKSNNSFKYTINSLYIGKKFTDDTFTFNKNKYLDFEIIDLR